MIIQFIDNNDGTITDVSGSIEPILRARAGPH